MNNILKCPLNVIQSIPISIVGPIVDQYLRSLSNQAVHNSHRLPKSFIDAFSGDYPDINMSDVIYAENIQTGHGQAITIDHVIYLPDPAALGTRSGNQRMLHELQHVVQYTKIGGAQPFLSKYVPEAIEQIMKNSSFNIHDLIPLEQDAIAKAGVEINKFGWQLKVH